MYNNLLNRITCNSTDNEYIDLFKKSAVELVERFMKENIEYLDELLYRFCLEENIKDSVEYKV